MEVLEVKKAYEDKLYYKVKLEEGSQFWVGLTFINGFEKVGAKLRLLGYFAKIDKNDISNKYHNDGFHMLAFAEVDIIEKKMLMDKDSKKQVEEWLRGTIPY